MVIFERALAYWMIGISGVLGEMKLAFLQRAHRKLIQYIQRLFD